MFAQNALVNYCAVRYVLLVLVLCSVALGAQAQFSGSGGGADSTDKNFSFVPVPYVSYDRTLGFSIGAVPMAMYRLNPRDTVSEKSISGLVGFYTTNKTWFGMAFSRFNFGQDKWRVVAAYGLGNFNYQFYLNGIGDYIPYSTGAQFLVLNIQRRVFKDIFLGISYDYTKFDTEFDVPNPVETTVELHGLGLLASLDTRSSQYYPRNGSESKITYKTYPAFIGNQFVSNRIELEHNHFIPMIENRDVIGARFYGGFGIGDLSFNQQFIVGNNDIRGYSQGQFRGDQMLAIQGEYRWNLHKKIGLVGFVGVATILDAINEEDSGKLLPGGGVGIRYLVFPESHMNVGFDLGVGLDDWGFYFRIGEAF